MSSSGIYLDHAATTPLLPEVVQWLAQPQLFGNPSSPHAPGRKAKELLNRARSWVAQDLDVEPNWVHFTASATESDNLAILGSAAALQVQGGEPLKLLCSAWEHPAVIEPLRRLEKKGGSLCVIPSSESAALDLEAFCAQLSPDTALVSVMAVHNELGLRLPIAQLGEILRGHKARLHCDGVQAMATQALRPRELGIDLLTLTAHKMGGPKGIGVLVRDPELGVEPLCVGGGQEFALRPGTENPHLAFAFALALRHTQESRERNLARYLQWREALLGGLRSLFPELVSAHERLPCAENIVALCLPGCQGAELVAALDQEGISISAGAACHAHGGGKASPAALRLGLAPELARGLIRVSFGPLTQDQHIEAIIAALNKYASRS